MNSKILYCFYDFSVSPPSYDFFEFMQTADLHRRRYSLDGIYFIFVPGPKEGFRDDSLSKSILQRYMLMRNVVVPACWLLPYCKGVSWLKSRDEISPIFESADHVFPRGYTLQKPINPEYFKEAQTCAYLRGETLAQLQEPSEYTQMVESFLANKITSQKLITVTVRDAPYYDQRNTDCSEWNKFLKKLNPAEYKIIIIPDTFNLWSQKIEGFEYCEVASVNILFRTALYRQAYLNMLTAQGPVLAAFNSGSPLLMFGPINTDVASTEEWYRDKFSLEPEEGNQYPMYKVNQCIAWGPETVGNLERGFNRFINDFPEIAKQPLKEHGIQSDRQRQLMCEAALRHIVLRMDIIQGFTQEGIDTLEAMIRIDNKFIGAKHLLGMIASSIGQHAAAIKLFDSCIELSNKGYHRKIIGKVRFQSGGSNTTEYHLLKAETLEKTNNLELALQEYLKIRETNPEDPEISQKILILQNRIATELTC